MFGIFKKKEEQAAFSFVQSSGFRGFKKFPIVIYGNKEAEANNEEICKSNLKGAQIEFRQTETNGKKALAVFVNGLKIGTVFDEGQIKSMTSGNIEAVYVKPDAETVADASGVITRDRAKLFVKYKEQ